MESNLVKSIYLQKVPMTQNRRQEPFGRTEEIMKEDSSASINQSAKKRSIKYHQFERTMMGVFDQGYDAYQQTPAKKYHGTYTNLSHQAQPQVQKKIKEKIQRPCHHSFRLLLDEYKLQARPKVEPKALQRRQKMCRQYEQRKADKIQNFKSNLLKRIKFETSDEVESSIQQQMISTTEAKQAKVQRFLKRQQFYAQQKEILREMREFCQYGAIKIN